MTTYYFTAGEGEKKKFTKLADYQYELQHISAHIC